MKNLVLTLFPCLLLLLSCGKEETVPASIDFVITNKIATQADRNFMLVSNQFGEILYDTIGERLENTIRLSVEPTEQIDVTYGYETPFTGGIRIWTYRDVESGFVVTTYDRICTPNIQLETVSKPKRQLTIEGLAFFNRKTHFPFSYLYVNSPQTIGNALLVEGNEYHSTDMVITGVQLGPPDTYRSMLLRHQDWEDAGPGSLTMTVDYDDFVPTQIHTIDLPELSLLDNEWKAEVTAVDPSGRPIRLITLNSNNDLRIANQLELYTVEGLPIDKLLIDVSSNYGYRHVRLYDAIPSSIELYEPSIEPIELGSESYELLVSQDPDMVKCNIIFNSGFLELSSSWAIFQKKESGLSFAWPAIPEYILDEYSRLRETLASPIAIGVEAFKVKNGAKFRMLYNQSTIDSQYDCLEFETKTRYFDL